MCGEFFAVGLGPGDPELLTIKAIKTMQSCEVIALPDSRSNTNIAYTIAQDYIRDKEIVYFDMPMSKDAALLEACHSDCANAIADILQCGKSVAFLTLGDPCIYSTVLYVHKKLTEMQCKTRIIPGVTSFCAAGAALNQSLCEKSEMLHIIPATFTDLEYVDSLKGNKILMKSGKTIGKAKEKFKDRNAFAVECATMPQQKVYQNLSEMREDASYFSIVFIKEEPQ